MKKFALFAAALAVAPSLAFSAPVFADSPGQLSNATTNYEVKNVTTGGAYAQSANATCGETVKYSVLLANSDFGRLTDLTVKANLSTGAINASATNAANATTSVSGKVTVAVAKGTLNYVPGSTVRFNGQTPTALADGVTSNGVNAGIMNGSTQTFVQFQAKVVCEPVVVPKDIQVCELATKTVKTIKENEFDAAKHSKNLNDCKTVVVPGKIQVCELATKKVISINENDFDSAKHSKDLNKCAEVAGVTTPTPTVIASTGPASTALTMLGLGSIAAAATYYVRSRRNILG